MITSSDILAARILIVDDLEANVSLLEQMLREAGYQSVTSTREPLAVCALHRRHPYDLILLDLQMPGMDGFQVMEGLKEIETDGYLPVLVITAQPGHKLRALKAGAKDFVSKPFDLGEVLLRVHNMVEVRLLHLEARRLYDQVIQCNIRDVAAQRTAEAALLQHQAELEQRVIQRTAELEAANQELDAFSYSISHDLRAPLRAMDGFSRAVIESYGPRLEEKGQRDLQRIREAAQRMGLLIDDLLAFSRLSRAPLRKQGVNTGDLVRRVIADLDPEQDGRPLELHIGELPACSGDPGLLRQVWTNLLSNAFKYTRKRAVAMVAIGCEPGPEGDVFFVRDNGTGFDPRYADKLFGVFQRLHRAEEFDGTGVGLAIVQRIVQRHGGRVWADAVVDGGATFRFTLGKKISP